MALHLIIDGYNLIRQSPHLSSIERQEFRQGREALLDCLSRYKSIRGHRITVIFDGWKGGDCKETRERVKGIRVVYSRLGETADEVIKKMVSQERERAVVVTLDSDIATFCLKRNAAVISPHEFESKIVEALYSSQKESVTKDENGFRRNKRKGTARRPSRTERRCRTKLRKL